MQTRIHACPHARAAVCVWLCMPARETSTTSTQGTSSCAVSLWFVLLHCVCCVCVCVCVCVCDFDQCVHVRACVSIARISARSATHTGDTVIHRGGMVVRNGTAPDLVTLLEAMANEPVED